jgi:hypothetical protein
MMNKGYGYSAYSHVKGFSGYPSGHGVSGYPGLGSAGSAAKWSKAVKNLSPFDDDAFSDDIRDVVDKTILDAILKNPPPIPKEDAIDYDVDPEVPDGIKEYYRKEAEKKARKADSMKKIWDAIKYKSPTSKYGI